MNCKYCTAELVEKEKICRWCGSEVTDDEELALAEGEVTSANDLIEMNSDLAKQKESNMIFHVIPTLGRIRDYTVTHKRITTITAATFMSICVLLVFLFLFIIPIKHKISECLIYMKGDSMYYTSLDKIKPTKMRDMTEIKEGMVDCLMINDKLKIFSLLGNDLYRATSSGSSKIASNVTAFYDNIEDNCVIYVTTEGTIYKNNGDNKTIKLADNAGIIKVSKDLKTIYYLQNNELFILKDNQDCVKIASNVKEVLQIYDDGEMYYTVDNSMPTNRVDSSLPMSQVDNFNPTPQFDSSSSTDQVISSNNFNTELVRVESMNEGLEKKDYDKNQGKLMEPLGGNGELNFLIDNENKVYNLYYYDGKESKLIHDKFIAKVSIDENNAVIFFKVLKESELNNQDQTSNPDNNGELLYKYNPDLETEILMCKKDKSILTPAGSDCRNFKECKGQYYYLRYENGNRYQLMCIAPQEDGGDQRKAYIGVIDSYELLDNQVVYCRSINSNTDGSSNGNINDNIDENINGNSDENFNDNINGSNESTENLLYLNYNIIDENVIGVPVDMNKLHNSFVYRKDYDQINRDYALMIYQNGKKSKIADHVYDYTRYEDDSILYLINKDEDKESFDAYLYNSKGDNVLIDKNVTKFPTHNNFAVNTGMVD